MDKEEKSLHEISDNIWLKIKGIPIPEGWSNEDREQIIKRYWHRAVESEWQL